MPSPKNGHPRSFRAAKASEGTCLDLATGGHEIGTMQGHSNSFVHFNYVLIEKKEKATIASSKSFPCRDLFAKCFQSITSLQRNLAKLFPSRARSPSHL